MDLYACIISILRHMLGYNAISDVLSRNDGAIPNSNLTLFVIKTTAILSPHPLYHLGFPLYSNMFQ